jgi:cell division protein FtsL
LTPVEPQAEIFFSGLVADASPARPPASPGPAPAGPAPAAAARAAPGTPAGPNEQVEPAGVGSAAHERHLRLVAPQHRRRRSRRLVACSAATGVLAVAFGLVGLHVVIAEAQFRLDRLQQEASAAQARYEKLRLSVAELEAPERIVSVAEGHGMQQPGSETYLPAPAGREGPSGGGAPAGRSSTSGDASAAEAPSVVQAPAGDANWPSVKPFLSGSP